MKKIAHVRNSNNAIVRYQDVEDAFDLESVAHLFGPAFECRLLPVVELPKPVFDPLVSDLVMADPAVEEQRVSLGWSIVPKPVPTEVANWQLEEEMASRNLITPLTAAIEAIPDPTARARAEARWNKKPLIRRSDPLILAIGGLLGLSSEQIDAIFRSASGR